MDMIYNAINEDIKDKVDTNKPNDIFISYYLGALINVGIECLKMIKMF